jgi:hypothetical protein
MSNARGKVTEVRDGTVVFSPAGTNYLLHLAAVNYTGPVNQPISAIVRVTARKVYTVPSGGNFIAPIFGQPRTLQGRVMSIADGSMVIHAGLPIVVDLPTAETAIDLDNGQITVGSMVNVVALPQARFALATDQAVQTVH